ncbi:epoxyqueuosine reductase [Shewanella sp. NFH-SH190041]|uniref:tRNA epoxyqueuosine(34) reductase QueG n=1 Tax=Shewanella sp. NFH-SH190041 TaxID=2950245 RepID=UPI0021C2E412|nr:tRNA epoxyqueuosine(34) reductase QueG [Shewanella sp. NFH-SH190041]BDM65687.1 epoxyqueuosine reductase [Shewanella sp. NFH-SH190041]
MPHATVSSCPDNAALAQLARHIKCWGKELGFAQVGICDTDLSAEEAGLKNWLEQGYHGEMGYMASHGMMRARPTELHPGCCRVICARMDYLPPDAGFATNLNDPMRGYISRYAGGRDYHKLIRKRMRQLGDRINDYLTAQGYSAADCRPFVDSAPIMERPLATKAGLGWTGKHTLLLNAEAGSWFFLAELVINLPLPVDIPLEQDCGSCVACIKTCPTGAIVAPYVIDSRRCISYLTIELDGAIPEPLRPLLGNRIYGCDDCQLICPVNAAAPLTQETDFHIRHPLQQPELLTLFRWSESEFLRYTEGSAIRRIGHQRWLRNIAVALGNAPTSMQIISALKQRLDDADISALVQEHIHWALVQQQQKSDEQQIAPQTAPQNAHSTTEYKLQRKQQRLVRSIEKGLPRDA